MDNFHFRRKLMSTNKTKDKFFCLVNFLTLPEGVSWKGIFYYVGKKTLRSVTISECLELKSFPYRILARCFDNKNHAKAIRQYSKYYYSNLDSSDRIDYDYGPINPLIMSVFNENSALVQELVNQYYYPSRIYNYVSPLEYAFQSKQTASINELCDALLKREETIYFSRSDFKYLLASDQKICHKVISTIMSPPDIKAMPNLIYMKQNVIAKSTDHLVSMALLLKREDELKEEQVKGQKENAKKRPQGANKYYSNNNYIYY